MWALLLLIQKRHEKAKRKCPLIAINFNCKARSERILHPLVDGAVLPALHLDCACTGLT